jgi:DtxR family transcriptional regulator, Mn-dependent transcriptional regulator
LEKRRLKGKERRLWLNLSPIKLQDMFKMILPDLPNSMARQRMRVQFSQNDDWLERLKMAHVKHLSASLEDYLEAIFNIISDKGAARSKDIAAYLGVKAGSVTAALQALACGGYLNYQPYEIITLTDKGCSEAKEIIRKHEILKEFFVEILGADPTIAEKDACKIEHVIGNKLFKRLLSFTEFVKQYPQYSDEMIVRFQGFYRDGKNMPCESKVGHY